MTHIERKLEQLREHADRLQRHVEECKRTGTKLDLPNGTLAAMTRASRLMSEAVPLNERARP